MIDHKIVTEHEKLIVKILNMEKTVLTYDHDYPDEIWINVRNDYQPVKLNDHKFLNKEIYNRLPIALKKQNIELKQDLIEEFIDNIQKLRIKEFLKEYMSKNHISEDQVLNLIEEIDDERAETESHR